MEPVYLDLHIHTSENPNSLNDNYDIDLLINKFNDFTHNSDFLISFTDHNTINKVTYLAAKDKVKNLLLGVELHIRNYSEKPPYHCHMFFDVSVITESLIDEVNTILNSLYPNKVVTNDDQNIPTLEKIINSFAGYEFILLPHGGQSHSTFDDSVPDNVKFDSTIERSIYYNQFDGFTARSNDGLERTIEYLKKLGINEFVNLVTCTDNYKPMDYPNAKSPDASAFIPTWMLALPTLNGLRLSLSESSRLVYSTEKPTSWAEYIDKITLRNEKIDIDVELTSGLNVVIGGSSSGKTLFVDSIFKKITGDFNQSVYSNFQVENIYVNNLAGNKPHYIEQSYINRVIDNKDIDNTIDDIEIIKNVFPGDEEIKSKVEKGLLDLRKDLKELINSVKTIEFETEKLSHIPILSRLLTNDDVQENVLNVFHPNDGTIKLINYNEDAHNEDIEQLEKIDAFLDGNPFIKHNRQLIQDLKAELRLAYEISVFENKIREIIIGHKKLFDDELRSNNQEQQTKKQNFEKLLSSISKYSKALNTFYQTLIKISAYSIKCESQVVESMGHKLYIENDFALNKNKFLEVINKYLKSKDNISDFENLHPENLFEANFRKQNPKI